MIYFLKWCSTVTKKYENVKRWLAYCKFFTDEDLFIKNRSKLSSVLLLCLLRFFMNKSLVDVIQFFGVCNCLYYACTTPSLLVSTSKEADKEAYLSG